MEVAGFAIGAVALGGQLTKASIECYSIFSEIGEVACSQDSILHELRTEAFRLRRWEQGWNLGCPTTTREGQLCLDPNNAHYRYALASLARIVLGFARLAELNSSYNKELEKLGKTATSKSKRNTLAPLTGRITRSRSKSPHPNTPASGPSQSTQVSDLTQKLSKLKFWENPESLQNPQSLQGLSEEIASLHEVTQSVQHALPGYRKLRWVLADKEKYNSIVHQLKKYIDGLFAVLPPNPPRFPHPALKKLELLFKIPFKTPNVRKDSHFVQRENLNKRLKTKIETGMGIGNINQVVLFGTGGMGKTQLALNYVSCSYREYSAVFWINAASEQTIKLAFTDIMKCLIHAHAQLSDAGTPTPDYIQIGQLLGMTGKLDSARSGAFSVQEPADERHVIEAVKQWLATEENTQWLLVFDNLDDLESFDINEYTPSCWHGTIIITSRRPESLIGRTGFEIQPMEDNEAQMLLLRSSNRDLEDLSDDELKQEQEAVAVITQKLGHLPLALDHAGSYIFKEQCTFTSYAKELEENISFYLGKGWKRGGDEESVFASWEMSFEVLRRRVPKATDLLSICGFLDNEDISEEFLRRGMSLGNNDTREFKESIQALFSYSFAKRKRGDKATCFNIHPLVHVWARNRLMREPELYSRNLLQALKIVGCAFGTYNSHKKSVEDWDFERRQMPHIATIESCIGKVGMTILRDIDDSTIVDCIFRLGELCLDHGRYARAKEWYQRALDWREQQLGADHPKTLATVYNMAVVFRDQGKYDMALEWYQRALVGNEKQLGADHPNTLLTVNCMAQVFQSQGKYDMALEWYQRALVGIEKQLGADHPNTLSTVGSVAHVFQSQGKYDMALEWYQRALVGMEKQLGADHPNTLTTVCSMAQVFQSQGTYDMALEWYQRALAGNEKQLGADHPNTLSTVGSVAHVFQSQGKYDMALEWYQRALVGREKQLGADHPNTLTTVHSMAQVFQSQGKYDMALEWYQRALMGREKKLGADHPHTQSVIRHLEYLYQKRNMFEEAEQLRSRFPTLWPASTVSKLAGE